MRKILLGAGIVLIGAIIAAVFIRHWVTGPLYRPGDVRAGKDVVEPLTPTMADGQHWKVAANIDLHHFEEGGGSEILTIHGGPGFPQLSPGLRAASWLAGISWFTTTSGAVAFRAGP